MTIQQLEAKYKETTPGTVNSFIWEVRTCMTSKSVASLQLLSLLSRIIKDFRPKAQALCDSTLPVDENTENEVFMHAKILCAQMLLLQSIRSYRELSEKILLLLEWSSCIGSSKENVAAVAIKCLSRQCTDTGLTWDVIRNAMSMNFLAYHVISRGVFDGAELAPLSYNSKGSVSIEKGTVYVSSNLGWAGGAKAWEECGSAIAVYTRNTRDEKLKASYLNNADRLALFAKTFTDSQNSASANQTHAIRDVKVGDKVTLRCEDIDSSEQPSLLLVSAMQTTLEKNGYILNEELIKGTKRGVHNQRYQGLPGETDKTIVTRSYCSQNNIIFATTVLNINKKHHE